VKKVPLAKVPAFERDGMEAFLRRAHVNARDHDGFAVGGSGVWRR